MSKWMQFAFSACGVVLLIGTIFQMDRSRQNVPETRRETVGRSTYSVADTDEPSSVSLEPMDTADEVKPKRAYISPIDFEHLQSQNPDIYAWLEVDGTEISYPLLQHSTDDSYYLKRGIDGTYDSAGSLFTEHQYNHTDFTDPVTVVYGHNMRNGDMFGDLQQYFSDGEFFSEHGEMMVYLPDRELRFMTFAAVPFENWHILHNVSFSNQKSFRAFFDYVLSIRAIGANFRENISMKQEDQVLILSTCLKGNRNRRYLVYAKRIDGV